MNKRRAEKKKERGSGEGVNGKNTNKNPPPNNTHPFLAATHAHALTGRVFLHQVNKYERCRFRLYIRHRRNRTKQPVFHVCVLSRDFLIITYPGAHSILDFPNTYLPRSR